MDPHTREVINRDADHYVVTFGRYTGAIVSRLAHDFLTFPGGHVVLEEDAQAFFEGYPERAGQSERLPSEQCSAFVALGCRKVKGEGAHVAEFARR